MFDLSNKWFKRGALALAVGGVLWASGIAPQAYNLIQNAGSALTKFSTLNFTGTGVTCANDTNRTTCTINGTGISNYSQTFTTQTSVTLTHNLATSAVVVQCFDAGSPPNAIIPQNIAITDTNNVAVTFGLAQSGKCIVNGAAAGIASSAPFSGLTSSTNSTAALVVGTGASLTVSGSGTINATSLNGLASLTGTGTIDFSSIADGNCAANTFTVTGAATGAAVAPRWPSTLESGLFGSMLVSASNTVQVRLCNLSGSAVDPASQTFGAVVLQ